MVCLARRSAAPGPRAACRCDQSARSPAGQLADETGASCCSPHTGRRRCRRALCGPAPPLARCRCRRPGGAHLPPDESIAGHLERWSFSSLGGLARRGLPDLGTSGSRHERALRYSVESVSSAGQGGPFRSKPTISAAWRRPFGNSSRTSQRQAATIARTSRRHSWSRFWSTPG